MTGISCLVNVTSSQGAAPTKIRENECLAINFSGKSTEEMRNCIAELCYTYVDYLIIHYLTADLRPGSGSIEPLRTDGVIWSLYWPF